MDPNREKKWGKLELGNGEWTKPQRDLLERVVREGGYDPLSVAASVLKWGQMMAVVLLETVKAVEREFGEKGQALCKTVFLEHGMSVGREIGKHLIPLLPERIDRSNLIETWLKIASWVNRNVWASPDTIKVISEEEGCFDILWCPHQDIYTARDCRIQRWIVSGIMAGIGGSLFEELEKRCGDPYEFFEMNVEVTDLIPKGAKTCHFRVWKRRKGEDNVWEKHSEYLERREVGKE